MRQINPPWPFERGRKPGRRQQWPAVGNGERRALHCLRRGLFLDGPIITAPCIIIDRAPACGMLPTGLRRRPGRNLAALQGRTRCSRSLPPRSRRLLPVGRAGRRTDCRVVSGPANGLGRRWRGRRPRNGCVNPAKLPGVESGFLAPQEGRVGDLASAIGVTPPHVVVREA
jgi:hypothetical protein